jgi:hypothetical protein
MAEQASKKLTARTRQTVLMILENLRHLLKQRPDPLSHDGPILRQQSADLSRLRGACHDEGLARSV